MNQALTKGEAMTSEPVVITIVSATESQLAEAFTEWDRRYREEPERFMSEAHHLLKETPDTYGKACAPYIIALLNKTI